MAMSKHDWHQTLREGFNDSDNAFRSKIIGAAVDVTWDYLAVTYPSSTQEVYTFKTGGSGGATVKAITVNYTTSAKDFISSVSVA